jgi:hypothetical protein
MALQFNHTIKCCVLLSVLFSACSHKQYHLDNNHDNEPVVKAASYTLNKPMTINDALVLDTNALYLQVFNNTDANETERANPAILRFHNDGYYKISSRRFYGKFDSVRTKQSAYYGGKFYLDGNKILTESFYPIQGGKTNYYTKGINKGSVKNDTLRLLVYGSERIYVKTTAKEIFN